jgi:hypothetical protein
MSARPAFDSVLSVVEGVTLVVSSMRAPYLRETTLGLERPE